MAAVVIMDSGIPLWGGARGHTTSAPGKEFWSVVRNGTVHDVEQALINLKKFSGNIDARNAFGSSALHIAVWRNHLPIIRRLLAAGADPDARDGESGWSSLHRALHFGHIAVAGVLIEAGASLALEDTKGRTPIDLTSTPVRQSLAGCSNLGGKEVFSWGNGSNYQLGIPSTGILRVPGRIDTLQGLDVVSVAAAKYHTVAVTASGELYSWGFGRGGRLGHPDFDIHSGQAAVITPRLLSHSFGFRGVSVIAVAKHHTIVATTGGEVYTWGSNREGRLGYPAVDTQPTPRRVTTLKVRVTAVAAANKHSAVVTEAGEVFTWGCNEMGQLGYGTSKSISNCIPRIVESLKGKKLVSVSTAKHHTVVLGAEGEVLTWGYKMVNPHRISVVRDTKKAGSQPLKFHISKQLHVAAISAGMTHSVAVSDDGLLFYWFSADPLRKCRQVMSLAAHQVVSVSSSKYRTVVATSAGDVFSWDGANAKADTAPIPIRIHGVKHATQLSVGENHSVVVAAVFIPEYPCTTAPGAVTSPSTDDDVDLDPELDDGEAHGQVFSSKIGPIAAGSVIPVPSLMDLCQRVAAQSILEPKNALQVLEFADSLGADILKGHCEELIVRNLDYVLTMAPVLFGHVRPSLLARVESALDACSTQSWSHRRLPTPSATSPVIIDSEEDDNGFGSGTSMRNMTREVSGTFSTSSDTKLSEGFLQLNTENGDAIVKQLRAVRKKLQQIEALELKQARGHVLDDQQLGKIRTKQELQRVLASLESGVLPEPSKKPPGRDEYQDMGASQFLSADGNPIISGAVDPKPGQLKKKRSKNKGSGGALELTNLNNGSNPTTSAGITASHGALTEANQSFKEIVQANSSPTTRENIVTILGFKALSKDPELRESERSSLNKGKGTQKNESSSIIELSPTATLSTATIPVYASADQSGAPRKMTPLGRKVKGGLSVFLSGALDDPPRATTQAPQLPVLPKVEGPAWGGTQIPKESTSLRDIQSEQKTQTLVFSQAVKVGRGTPPTQVTVTKQVNVTKQTHQSPIVIRTEDTTVKRVPLSQYVRTSPVGVGGSSSSSGAHPENSTPPWAAATSPSLPISLHDIQLEQVKSKGQQRHSHPRGSPGMASPIGTLTASAGSSSSDHSAKLAEMPNRWFKPDIDSPSTLHCIQIEEKAMKELGRLYKNVKLVRNDGSS